MSTESYTVPAGVFSGSTQAEADLKAYTYACYLARLKCHPHVTPIIAEDMPLEQAVYVPTPIDKIFGVRGGYIYQCNASTGARETTVRFSVPCLGDASITYDSVTGKLFVGFWHEERANDLGTATLEANVYKLLYRIDPSTLSTEATSEVDTRAAGSKNTDDWNGPHQMRCYSGVLYLIYSGMIGIKSDPICTVNTTTLAEDIVGDTAMFNTGSYVDMCIQPASGGNNAQVWTSIPGAELVKPRDTSDLTYGTSPYSEVDTTALFPAPFPVVYGICWCAATGEIYGTCRSETVVYFTPTVGAPSAASFNTGDTNAFPYRIQYCNEALNSFYGKVLLPGYKSNNVTVIDPVTRACTIKTGFDSPFDVVFTPTKAFAVQHGTVGLKEIT